MIVISAVDDSASGAVMTSNRLDNVRRINVAVSRARDRLYFYHSFARADLSELDLRARLIDTTLKVAGEGIRHRQHDRNQGQAQAKPLPAPGPE